MAQIGLDSNILLYALLEPDSDKGAFAEQLIVAVASRGVLALQALAETLAVVRRKRPSLLAEAARRVGELSLIYDLAPTGSGTLARAETLILSEGFRAYDALIVVASAEQGADILLSEDMQDGRRIAGLRILNPFNPDHRGEIDALLD